VEIRQVGTKLFHADRRRRFGYKSFSATLRARLIKLAMITTNQPNNQMDGAYWPFRNQAVNKLNDAIKSHYMQVFSVQPCTSVIQVFRVRCAFKSLCNVTFTHTTFTNNHWLNERLCKPRPLTSRGKQRQPTSM
jgi:hypothetical protein